MDGGEGKARGAAEAGGPTGGVQVDEESLARLGDQIRDVMRKAMKDLIQEEVEQGAYDHVLKLWKEVQDRLMRLSGSPQEKEKTKAAIDCDYAQELVAAQALDNSILGDMIQLCSQRIGALGAVAYEKQVLDWGLKLADEMRAGETRTPAEILAEFFDTADTLLTRIEAGVAAHLLCQAMSAYPGPRQQQSKVQK